jgi:CDP-diacylglycerol--glycerol-3-phosphate 3-phosphatidyltransferase
MKWGQIYNASNFLSLVRLLLIIPLWFAFENFTDLFFRYSVAVIGIFAAITDILDGYLARKLNQVSEFGKLIDPLADKVLIIFVVTKLFLLDEIPGYYFYMIIFRDVLIFVGGIIVSKKIGKVLPSDYIGKATVLAISFVLLLILFQLNVDSILFQLLYYLSIGLIFISFSNYLFRAVKLIREIRK